LIQRRTFLTILAGGLLAAPLAAEAQPAGRVYRVGYLSPLSPSADATRGEAFLQGLRELGYVEGQNLVIERRFADGTVDRFPDLATELVRLKVDVILAGGGGVLARAAQSATSTIPIVMTNVEDPVAGGLVASLGRPGRNVTGLTSIVRDLSAKRLQLLHEILPKVSRVAVLWNSAYPGKAVEFSLTLAAARTLGIRLQPLEVQSPVELEGVFEATANGRAEALIVLPDPLTNTHHPRIVELAAKRRLPTMFSQRPFVVDGGLVSYGQSYTDLFRRAAGYVDRILKGAKPADLPVEQPRKFELIINLKTAKALGLTIPQSLLLRADEVIQ
jgi:putative ABC transport system substrate-binding protein